MRHLGALLRFPVGSPHVPMAARVRRADKTAERVEREVHKNGVDLVLHVGDISYANGVVKIWDTFMRYIEPYASMVPYMIGIGNHEYDYKTGREKSRKQKRHTDASGSEEPYDPDWGNYGAPWLGSVWSLMKACLHSNCTAYLGT